MTDSQSSSRKPPQRFGKRLQQIIDETERSQSSLAEECDYSPSLISRLISGERAPRPEQALAIANVLGCSAVDLLTGTDQESLLHDWVTIVELTRLQERVAASEREAASLRTQLDGALARAESLRLSLAGRINELAAARAELAQADVRREQLRSAEAAVERARKESVDLLVLIEGLIASERSREAKVKSLEIRHDELLLASQQLAVQCEDWRRVTGRLEAENERLRAQRHGGSR